MELTTETEEIEMMDIERVKEHRDRMLAQQAQDVEKLSRHYNAGHHETTMAILAEMLERQTTIVVMIQVLGEDVEDGRS